MKSVLVILSVFFLGLQIKAQETNWKLYSSADGIEIYTMESDCFAKNIPDQKAVLIKVVNTTGDELRVEWDQLIWYNGELNVNETEGEDHHTVEMEKNSSREGSCDVPYGALYIYKDFITYQTETKLTNFELQNIEVSRQ